MAALEKIRNKAGLLIGFVGFALFAFIIGDFITSGGAYSNLIKQNIGNVDGHKISAQEYQARIQQFSEISKMNPNTSALSDAQIKDNVWNNYVYSSLLSSECEKIGLTITDEEFNAFVATPGANSPLATIPFLCDETGKYNPMILKQIIDNKENPNIEAYYRAWKYWEETFKTQMLTMKYQNLIASALTPTKKLAEKLASLGGGEFDVAVVRKDLDRSLLSEATVSDADIKAIYDKKKELFKTEPYRGVKVIVFDVAPSEADYNDIEAAVTASKAALDSMPMENVPLYVTQSSDREYPYNATYRTSSMIDPGFAEFAFSAGKGAVSGVVKDGAFYKVAKVMSDVVSRPDSIRASRIIVFRNTLAESQVLADSLMAELKKGANFAEMVKNFSQDAPAIVEKDGDLEWFREGALGLEEFDDKAFTANVGEYLSFPVQQAVMLVKITDKTKAVKKVKLAEIVNKVEAGTDTYRDIYDQARQFVLANKDLASFEAAAKEAGLEVRSLSPLMRNQNEVAVLPQSREIIKWAWDHKVGEVADKVFELSNQYVVAALSESVDAEYVPFEYAKASLEYEARNAKVAEKMMADMSSVSMDSAEVVKSVKFTDNTMGRFYPGPSVIGILAGMNADQVSEPIKGADGVYVLKVVEKRPAELSESVVNSASNLQKSIVRDVMYRDLFRSLKDVSDITDTRYDFY